ncbi:hypothetical protein [Mycetocola sp. 2940]|uniref:hypothetical protein n=1 Tax=Mycetocola sp. 2940 TaxID=3156452 RepID=UPI003398C18F
MTQDSASGRPARRNLIILVSVIAALVLVSLLVVFTRGEAELLDESTPEGVVQRYSMAVLDGDDAAVDYLASVVQEQCETVDNTVSDDMRVTLIASDLRDESADVTVQISTHEGGAFGSEYSYEEDFRLVREGGDWVIESAPWSLTVCLRDGEFK